MKTPFVDSTHLEPQEAYVETKEKKLRILCTTSDDRIWWGSYKIRCIDFKVIVETFFSNIAVVDTLPLSKLDFTKNITFDATILMKTINIVEGERFGHIFVDVVDEYTIHTERNNIPNDWTIIAQNTLQADVFSNHKSIVVPHWFTSFSSDTESSLPPMDKIFENKTYLIKEKNAFNFDTSQLHDNNTRFKTVMIMDTAGAATCDTTWGELPDMVTFDCIDEMYDISEWYHKYLNISSKEKDIIVQELGKGYLYRKLFHQYDALIAPPKRPQGKMQYNSMHRTVSQMRSGVPVILGCYGGAHQKFCHQHNYSCTYSETTGSFEAIAEKMKNSPALRRQCQMEGYEISKLYSPKKVVGDYLESIYQIIHSRTKT